MSLLRRINLVHETAVNNANDEDLGPGSQPPTPVAKRGISGTFGTVGVVTHSIKPPKIARSTTTEFLTIAQTPRKQRQHEREVDNVSTRLHKEMLKVRHPLVVDSVDLAI